MKHDAGGLYLSYMHGWHDGAGVRGYNITVIENGEVLDPIEIRSRAGEYDRGYRDGQKASRAAAEKAAKRLHYKVLYIVANENSILRNSKPRRAASFDAHYLPNGVRTRSEKPRRVRGKQPAPHAPKKS